MITLLDIISSASSFIALAGAVYVFFSHDRRLKIQEAKLNELTLKEAVERAEEKQRARIRAFFISRGAGKSDLVISNIGASEVRNFRIEILDGSAKGCLLLNGPLFIEQLSPGSQLSFHYVVMEGASGRIHLRYYWEDDFQSENTMEEYLQRD